MSELKHKLSLAGKLVGSGRVSRRDFMQLAMATGLTVTAADALFVKSVRAQPRRGGTGPTVAWPSILPMWFHYRNPVSGRLPENYWPDCVPCVKYPETSMTRHGYLLPPN